MIFNITGRYLLVASRFDPKHCGDVPDRQEYALGVETLSGSLFNSTESKHLQTEGCSQALEEEKREQKSQNREGQLCPSFNSEAPTG